jgi:hypothetical protein
MSPSKRRKTGHGDSSSSRSKASSLSNSKREKEFIDSSRGKGSVKKQKGENEGSKVGSIIGRKRKARSLKAGRRSA